MSEALKRCPFCGGDETIVWPQNYWTGMSNQIISVEVRHFCKTDGLQGSRIIMRAKTEDEAVALWNNRVAARSAKQREDQR